MKAQLTPSKLGYGGTKSEMERLLADAEKLTGVHYDINNLGDVYAAIHAIQGDLGLTGVAAAEASTTFSGSFNAMKASAQNLLGSIALGQNVGPAMNQLVTSVSTFFFGNFIPMLGTIIKSLPGAIYTFLQQGLPTLVSNITSLITNIGSTISSLADGQSLKTIQAWAKHQLPRILAAGAKLVLTLAQALVKNLPKIVVAIGKIGLAIVKGLGSALWGKVKAAANGIKERFMAPITALKDKIKSIVDKIKGFFSFKISKPNIPMPHFRISPAGWRLGDLLKGTIPSLGISWYAKGGIVDGATLIGAGEAGKEAIVPLDPFWKRLEETASNSNSTNIVININGANKDPREIAAEVKRILIRETNQRRLAWQ